MRRLSIFFLGLVLLSLAGCLGTQGPIAVLHVPTVTGHAPLDVAYDLSYCRDTRGDAITFRLDFGDGSPPAEGATFDVIFHHTFQTDGVFRSDLVVTNSHGETGYAAETITVSRDGPPVGIQVGMTAPDFTAHTTGGGTITLSQFRGKVVLLEFWGAWCNPCRVSMPHLQDLAREFGQAGLVVVAVSTDVSKQDAIDFLAQNGYTEFVSVWEPGGKRDSRLTKLYGVADSVVPRTFLLDRQGVIRYVGHPNDLGPGDVEALL